MNELRRQKGRVSVLAVAAIALVGAGQALTGTAQAATTLTIAPATPNAVNYLPFGSGTGWTPNMGFVYKNLPRFRLKPKDTLAFDLKSLNNVDIQLTIGMAATTVNGGDVPAAAFATIVPNTQIPANPRGNTTAGDFELKFKALAPFNFAGGGLIIRFSSPGGAFASDTLNDTVLYNLGSSSDASGFFVKRFYADPDGAFPWTTTDSLSIGAFRLILKCKKQKKGKKGASAAKKCKKKKKRK